MSLLRLIAIGAFGVALSQGVMAADDHANNANHNTTAATAKPATTAAAEKPKAEPVNINSASADQLKQKLRFSKKVAMALVEAREKQPNKQFASSEDLIKAHVDGLKARRIERLVKNGKITFGAANTVN